MTSTVTSTVRSTVRSAGESAGGIAHNDVGESTGESACESASRIAHNDVGKSAGESTGESTGESMGKSAGKSTGKSAGERASESTGGSAQDGADDGIHEGTGDTRTTPHAIRTAWRVQRPRGIRRHLPWRASLATLAFLSIGLGMMITPAAPAKPVPAPGPKGDDLVSIAAGCYQQGAPDNYADERPRHRVCLAAFRIQQFEVTVEAYGRCVAAGRCAPPVAHMAKHPTRRLCNFRAPGRETHPVNCVTWDEARAFCAWRGLRLPWEAEWERAAAGPGGAAHPWGRQEATCAQAVVAEAKGRRLVPGCGAGGTLPIGARVLDRSAAGVRDLAGGVSEWTQDWFDLGAYKDAPATQPRGPRRGRARVVRGGSFRTPPGSRLLRITARQFAGAWDPTIGLRCAQGDPAPARERP